MSEAIGPALDPDVSRQRIEELEARVKWLEGALTSVLQERRSLRRGQTAPFSFDESMIAPDAPAEQTQPLAVLERKPASPPAVPPDADTMRFTSAFSTLDERLLEQLEAERAPAAAGDMEHPVLIDPELIDRAFARPLPERIDVRCALEESYPHLMERILVTWREPESQVFLRKLIVDDRGSRQGFPFDVMSELLVLSAVAEAPEGKARA